MNWSGLERSPVIICVDVEMNSVSHKKTVKNGDLSIMCVGVSVFVDVDVCGGCDKGNAKKMSRIGR